MNPHERQQFDLLLLGAAESFAERLVHRNGGAGAARERLERAPEGDGVWLTPFIDALFREHLLDTTAGACFVLQALARRPAPLAGGGTIDDVLQQMARAAFATLLLQKTDEELARRSGFASVDTTRSS